jgi:hypothetical protein
VNLYLDVRCVTESDGFHTHEYQAGAHTVVEHLHSWMDEHRANWPDAADVDIRLGQRETPFHGSVGEAWAELTDEPRPGVTCLL